MAALKRGEKVGLIRVPVSIKAFGTPQDPYDALFLIDTGAIDSMAPSNELHRAGIEPVGKDTYELADGSHQEYAFGLAQIEFMGEVTAGRVIFGPDDVQPLLGVTALESTGVAIDPTTQTLKKIPALRL